MGVSAAIGAAGAVPIGVVNPFAGSTAPSTYLLCFGQAVSRSEYAGLFAVISTTYGSGDGSTTFNVPDLRGRAVAGVDNMGGTDAGRLSIANTLGTATGAETHTLSSAEMPSHTHTQNSHNHTQNAHAHDFIGRFGGSTTISSTLSAPGSANFYGVGSDYVASATATNQAATATNNNTGGSSAHNNMQPTIVLNYIIKAQ